MKLLAGPFLGEFGWELFCWQGRLRRLSKQYDETCVFCKKGHEILYKDFAKINKIPSSHTLNCDHAEDIDVIPGNFRLTFYSPFWSDKELNDSGFLDQDFCKYNKIKSPTEYDIIFHARSRQDIKKQNNWSLANWNAVNTRFTSLGLKTACIGLTDRAHEISNCDNLMNIPLFQLVEYLSSAKLIVGTSSGPLHLASLCGCPQVVLTGNLNIVRYKNHWNAFNTKVSIVPGGWLPSVNDVIKYTLELLKQI